MPEHLPCEHLHHRFPACRRCWNPQYDIPSRPDKAWNQFISHITGGLLSGKEVVRPPGYDPVSQAPAQRRTRRDPADWWKDFPALAARMGR